MIAQTKLLCCVAMVPPTQHLMSLSYIHVHVRTLAEHMYICTYVHSTHVLCTYVCMYTCTVHGYVHMYVLYMGMYTCSVHMYACTFIHTYMYTSTHVHTCIGIIIAIHVRTCMPQVHSIVHWCLYCMGGVCTCNSLLFLNSWRVIRLCQLCPTL